MSNFDVANIALQAVCPSNEMLYDDKGMPSVMVKIPKQTWADLGVGTSTDTFPAWIINGHEVDYIYFSKYESIVFNSRAYSLPAQNPAPTMNLDTAATYCSNKGEGWHLQTRLEWMAIALWCLKNKTLPYGNNNFGKDSRETLYKAIPSCAKDAQGRIQRVATGTGPISWSHNREQDGIWDMNGNIWEWVGGVRLVYGELQVISNDGITFGNDAADPDNSQSETSTLWRAIDGTTGALITPDGKGTTANSLKLDFVNNAWKWITGTISSSSVEQRSAEFEATTIDDTVCDAAEHILQALGFYKTDTTTGIYENDSFYAVNGEAERSFCCGGVWFNSVHAGVFAVSAHSSRANLNGDLGIRPAYVELPTA